MEASLKPRGTEDEEHSSSESGWTMYIGSSISENDHYNYIGEHDNNNSTHHKKEEEGYGKNQCRRNHYGIGTSQNDEESDDSMASDASSGPSNQKFPCSSEQNLDCCKHETLMSTSAEKLHKQVIKRDQRRNKIDKETLELKTISGSSHVHVGSQDKVNITNYMSQEE